MSRRETRKAGARLLPSGERTGGRRALPTLNSAESWGVYSRVQSARTSAASCSAPRRGRAPPGSAPAPGTWPAGRCCSDTAPRAFMKQVLPWFFKPCAPGGRALSPAGSWGWGPGGRSSPGLPGAAGSGPSKPSLSPSPCPDWGWVGARAASPRGGSDFPAPAGSGRTGGRRERRRRAGEPAAPLRRGPRALGPWPLPAPPPEPLPTPGDPRRTSRRQPLSGSERCSGAGYLRASVPGPGGGEPAGLPRAGIRLRRPPRAAPRHPHPPPGPAPAARTGNQRTGAWLSAFLPFLLISPKPTDPNLTSALSPLPAFKP